MVTHPLNKNISSNSTFPKANPSAGNFQKSTRTTSLEKLAKAKGLTPVEIIARRNRNQCFGCEEKWHIGHKCKTQQVYIMDGFMQLSEDKEDESSESDTEDGQEALAEHNFNISLQALYGIPSMHTIRLQGFIKSQPVTILVDSGSTHSYLNSKIAKKLNLPITKSKNYEVTVANGEKLQGSGQDCVMPIYLLLLPMKGCQLVLGVQWLKELDDVTFNFKKLQVKFSYNHLNYVWQGISVEEPKMLDEKIIDEEVKKGQLSFLLQYVKV